MEYPHSKHQFYHCAQLLKLFYLYDGHIEFLNCSHFKLKMRESRRLNPQAFNSQPNVETGLDSLKFIQGLNKCHSASPSLFEAIADSLEEDSVEKTRSFLERLEVYDRVKRSEHNLADKNDSKVNEKSTLITNRSIGQIVDEDILYDGIVSSIEFDTILHDLQIVYTSIDNDVRFINHMKDICRDKNDADTYDVCKLKAAIKFAFRYKGKMSFWTLLRFKASKYIHDQMKIKYSKSPEEQILTEVDICNDNDKKPEMVTSVWELTKPIPAPKPLKRRLGSLPSFYNKVELPVKIH